jgi:hypothetical protein
MQKIVLTKMKNNRKDEKNRKNLPFYISSPSKIVLLAQPIKKLQYAAAHSDWVISYILYR